MDKKEFTILLRTVIRTEMKPIVKEAVQKAVAKEFKTLRALLVPTSQNITRTRSHKNINIDDLMEDEGILLRDVIEQDEVEMAPKRKLFKKENVFTDMLQQTLNEGYVVGSIQKQVSPVDVGQQVVQISEEGEKMNRHDMVNAIGYGEMGNNIRRESVPGVKTVQLPTTTHSGKVVDPNALPGFLLNALTKNYSKTLEDSKKADKLKGRRGK